MIGQTISYFCILEKLGEGDFGFACKHTATRCAQSRGSTILASTSHVSCLNTERSEQNVNVLNVW